MFFSKEIGIDLGTSSILAYTKEKIVLNEPSVVAVNRKTENLIAAGKEAQKMLGKTPEDIIAIRPLKDGVISNYTLTEKMLKYYIKNINKSSLISPKVMICIPSEITEVEKKAVIDAAEYAGIRKVYLIEEPIAAAIGAGIDISKPRGNMVIDIGGGTTDIAVISMYGKVVSRSIKIAGDTFDEYISRFLKRKYNIIIGEKTAEDLKKTIGCVYPKIENEEREIGGRDVISGLPKNVVVTSRDIYAALRVPVYQILDMVKAVLEETPPELIADISKAGIYLSGGGSLVSGFDVLFHENIGIDVHMAENPETCVVKGTYLALKNKEKYINRDVLKG